MLIQQEDMVVNELQRLIWDFAYLGHGITLDSNQEVSFQEYNEPLMLTHFLAISKPTIVRLVDFLEEVLKRPGGHTDGGPMHVDGAYSTFRQQNQDVVTLIANPSLGFQRASSSNVANPSWFETLPVVSQLSTAARKAKNWYRRMST